MSKKTHHSSHTLHKSDHPHASPKHTLTNVKHADNSGSNTTVMQSPPLNFIEDMKRLEGEADQQSAEVELNELIEFISQLVDLFKHAIIMSELQSEDDWHENVRHQLKRNKGVTGNILLDDKIEKIAIKKGLTKEQWIRLLYINFTAGDTLEMNTVSRSHLKTVYNMALRLLVGEEQASVLALIEAIQNHMPTSHFI